MTSSDLARSADGDSDGDHNTNPDSSPVDGTTEARDGAAFGDAPPLDTNGIGGTGGTADARDGAAFGDTPSLDASGTGGTGGASTTVIDAPMGAGGGSGSDAPTDLGGAAAGGAGAGGANGTGGANGGGGTASTGGVPALDAPVDAPTGGSIATGGVTTAAGGATAAGGSTSATGGATDTGGTTTATGGTTTMTGGITATGGTTAAGGSTATTGGITATGGTTSTGGTTTATGGTTSSGGTTPSSGGAGGGTGPIDPASIVPDLDGFYWEATCSGNFSPSGKNCPFFPTPTSSTCPTGTTWDTRGTIRDTTLNVRGTTDTQYTINFEVRGVVGTRCYTGGTAAYTGVPSAEGPNNTWYVGGTQAGDSIWNTYELHVSPPVLGEANVYFFNAFPSNPNWCQKEATYEVGYAASFKVLGGGTMKFTIHDANCMVQQNCGSNEGATTCTAPRTVDLSGMSPPASFVQPPTNSIGGTTYYPQWLYIDVKSVTSP